MAKPVITDAILDLQCGKMILKVDVPFTGEIQIDLGLDDLERLIEKLERGKYILTRFATFGHKTNKGDSLNG
jgi:hypothetical protein